MVESVVEVGVGVMETVVEQEDVLQLFVAVQVIIEVPLLKLPLPLLPIPFRIVDPVMSNPVFMFPLQASVATNNGML